jgi:hypothetical protein
MFVYLSILSFPDYPLISIMVSQRSSREGPGLLLVAPPCASLRRLEFGWCSAPWCWPTGPVKNVFPLKQNFGHRLSVPDSALMILWRERLHGPADTEVTNTKIFKEHQQRSVTVLDALADSVSHGNVRLFGGGHGGIFRTPSLFKTSNNLQRGAEAAELTWLSVFPGEAETLYPPLTFMQPTGREQVIEYDGIKLTVVECTTTLPVP